MHVTTPSITIDADDRFVADSKVHEGEVLQVFVGPPAGWNRSTPGPAILYSHSGEGSAGLRSLAAALVEAADAIDAHDASRAGVA